MHTHSRTYAHTHTQININQEKKKIIIKKINSSKVDTKANGKYFNKVDMSDSYITQTGYVRNIPIRNSTGTT